jgi:hypothetical protein
MELVAEFPEKLGFLFEKSRYKCAFGGRGKYFKLFTEKTELTGKDGSPFVGSIVVKLVRPGETGEEKTNA